MIKDLKALPLSKEALLSPLNDEQKQAVLKTDGPLLIIAGAGSGKTTTITTRIAYLLLTKKARPEEILAMTFTNKAAEEMKERVISLVGHTAKNVTVSTFHSMCCRMLRNYALHLDYKPGFTIYDDDLQLAALKDAIPGSQDAKHKYGKMKEQIERAKDDLKVPADFNYAPTARERQFGIYYKAYQEKLLTNNAMDFGDLILNTYLLLNEYKDVRNRYQKQFKYILIDEFQDTNAAQLEVARLLTGETHNICVCGDDDQSIYGWRGADIRNIAKFKKYFPEYNEIKLIQNYRSTNRILACSNAVIANNNYREAKTLHGNIGTGSPVHVASAHDNTQEYHAICKKIKELENTYALEDIAILGRTRKLLARLDKALIEENIEHSVESSQSVLEKSVVKNFLAYLMILRNPADDVSLKRIINVPKRGIGQTTISRIEAYAKENKLSMLEAISQYQKIPALKAKAQKNIADFYQMIKHLKDVYQSEDTLTLIESILGQSPVIKITGLNHKSHFLINS